MKRLLTLLVTALLAATAAAGELPDSGEVLLSADGSLVGVGEFEDGKLELELLADFSGTATITLVDEEGNEYSEQVVVSSDHELEFEAEGELAAAVEEDGATVEITLSEKLEADGELGIGHGVPDHVELPEEALEGMARAEENQAEAQARAEENQAEAEARAEAKAEAGAEEDGEAEAEASVGVGIGVGRR